MTLKLAKSYFPEYLSPCCSATVHASTCLHCGNVVPMPFFLVATRELPDSEAIEIERVIRHNPNIPVGAEMVLRVGDHKPPPELNKPAL